MAYPDGPSPSEEANAWMGKTFNNNFLDGIFKHTNPIFGQLGKLKYGGPRQGNPLGTIQYEGPQRNQGGNRPSSPAPSNNRPSAPSNYNTDDARDRAMAGRSGLVTGPNQMPPEDTSEQDAFDALLGRANAKWGGGEKSGRDYTPLDKALEARIGMLNDLRNQTQGNFDKSDANLGAMHNALQDDLRGRGAGVYNTIADTEQSNLRGIQEGAQGRLQGIKNEDMAKRAAMLKELGIEAAGGQEDSSAAVLSDAQANIASRGQAEQANSEGDRASNLAYNQGIVASVGQQGVERRGALAQQLQQVFGKLSQAEAEYRANDQEARIGFDQQADDRQYAEFNNDRAYARESVNRMEDRAWQVEDRNAKGGTPQKVAGYSGLAQDLVNTGYDPQAIQGAMGALSKVLGSEYLKDVNPNQGYSQTAIIHRKLVDEYNVDPNLAIQLATNYGNLGTSNSY